MKYKLINKQTKEEHLCDKVTIDRFEYYVSDNPKTDDYCLNLKTNEFFRVLDNSYVEGLNKNTDDKKVIATNNPNIDIPKVVCNIDLTKLCYYDRRNPDFSIKEEYGYDKEEVEATGNFAKKDCACDNCFYGRSQLTEQLIKSQETHPNSDEDMIEFAIWLDTYYVQHSIGCYENIKTHSIHKTQEILQLWKEQQPKVLFYE